MGNFLLMMLTCAGISVVSILAALLIDEDNSGKPA